MKLSIVITSYNTKYLLKQCLTSLRHSPDNLQKEIIVVDNASEDGSPEMVQDHFKEVKLLKLSRNQGYGRANNVGLKHATGEYILFLNSDTFVPPGTLTHMVAFMDTHPEVGVATCQVDLPDGRLDPACHRGFPTPWAAFTFFTGLERLFPHTKLFGQYHQGWKNLNRIHEIDTPAGAFYLTRKKVLDQIGGFDEQFFIYAEDIDLSLRIKEAGWKIVFVPAVSVTHLKKRSGRDKEIGEDHASKTHMVRQKTSAHFFSTMKLFYDKHYHHRYSAFSRWFILLGIWFVSKIKK